jgi:hypothetical protein
MKHLSDKLQGFNRVYTATTIDEKFYMCVCVRVCVCVCIIYIYSIIIRQNPLTRLILCGSKAERLTPLLLTPC